MSRSPCPQPRRARRSERPDQPVWERRLDRALTLIPIATTCLVLTVSATELGQESAYYTLRFGGVKQIRIHYNRSRATLNVSAPRAVWTGAGASTACEEPPCDGVDGLFFDPRGGLVVANWQNSSIWVFDPTRTDRVEAGPIGPVYNNTFHLRAHPNGSDFFITSFSGQGSCPHNCTGQGGRFGVASHSPLEPGVECILPGDPTGGFGLEPVTFAFDAAGNGFAIFSDGRDCAGCPEGSGIQFGGGGFGAFDPGLTNSSFCDPGMSLTELIPQEIPAAHSMVYDPFLSHLNATRSPSSSPQFNVTRPHSDFLLFANSRIAHVRVVDPGALNATAGVVGSVDFSRLPCELLPPPPAPSELGEGAVSGRGHVLVGDRVSGRLLLLDYSQNENGTIFDSEMTVCVASALEPGIDAIAPLVGPGSPRIFGDGFESGNTSAWSRTRP